MNNKRKGLFILILFTIFCYFNTLAHQFVWDDETIILSGRITDFFLAFKSIFSPEYFQFSKEQSFRPLTTLSYLLDAFGWDLKPLGYHLTNLVLHLLNVTLVFYLAHNLGLSNQAVRVAAAIFAVHPLQTEAINVISYREELLVTFFYLSAFLLLIRKNENKRTKIICILTGTISYLLALLAKEMALSFLLVFLMYHGLYNNSRKKILSCPLGFIIFITAGYLILRFIFFPGPAAGLLYYPAGNLYKNILTTAPILIHYLRLFFFPVGLKAEYPIIHHASLFEREVITSIILLGLIGGLLIKIKRSDKKIIFGWLWIGLTLLPVANFFPNPEMIAERYLYLPLVGLALLAGRAFEYFFVKDKLRAILVTASLIAFFSALTYSRNYIWRNDLTLWETSRHEAPASPRLHHNLGNAYLKSGQNKMARVEYRVAIELNPGYDRAYNNLGVAYALSNKPDLARTFWQKALELNPNSATAILNLKKHGRP